MSIYFETEHPADSIYRTFVSASVFLIKSSCITFEEETQSPNVL